MQTEQRFCVRSGMTDTGHSATSGSNKEERVVTFNMNQNFDIC